MIDHLQIKDVPFFQDLLLTPPLVVIHAPGRLGPEVAFGHLFIDKRNVIPPNTEIGYDPEDDRKRFTVTPRGIVVVAKGTFT